MSSTYERTPSAYEKWVKSQGVPLATGYGVEDVRALELAPWPLMGCAGAVVKLTGMEGLTGMFVLQVPPGEASETIHHLFEKIVYVLEGEGRLIVEDPRGGQPEEAHLSPGTLVAAPVNARHRFESADTAPLRLLCFTNAPMIMDIFQDPDFAFSSNYVFQDRFPEKGALFSSGANELHQPENIWLWDASIVEDVPGLEAGLDEKKGAGVGLTQFEMSRGILVTHIADWPVGSYQKAHYHGGGATLLIVRGTGYTLMWPQEAGIQPYASGNEDKVVRVDWKVGSVMSPLDGWFHQHFNTSDDSARQLAFRYGSRRRGVEFHDLRKAGGVYKSIKEGGTLIEYEDEDPAIARIFEEARAQA